MVRVEAVVFGMGDGLEIAKEDADGIGDEGTVNGDGSEGRRVRDEKFALPSR